MKYKREQWLDCAHKIYGKEMTITEAVVRYDLNLSTVKGYRRLYRAENDLSPGNSGSSKSAGYEKICRKQSKRSAAPRSEQAGMRLFNRTRMR